MATWRELILSEMEDRGETWADVVHCTLYDEILDVEFDDGFGATEGKPFTLWTTNRVYFPRCYDGAEGVASVPRNPCNEVTEHIGGG